MKRVLFVLATAVLFLQTLALPTVASAEGGATGTNCGGNTLCKP